MHNSFFTLSQVSLALRKKIQGSEIESCFSQNKDELIIIFRSAAGGQLVMRCYLSNTFTCLGFPETFNRSKRNNVSLFEEIIGKKVLDVFQYSYERAFHFSIEGQYILLFKMFGNNSNLVLYHDGKFISTFKKRLHTDKLISPGDLDRKIDISFEKFIPAQNEPWKLIPAFDKKLMKELLQRGYQHPDPEKKYDQLQLFLKELESPAAFYINNNNGEYGFSLFPFQSDFISFSDPLEALEQFYQVRIHQIRFDDEKGHILKSLEKRKEKTEKYIETVKIKLDQLEKSGNYRDVADLIMANLNVIPKRAESIILKDLYTGLPVTVKLKPDLTPVKNAELYYRKSKNQQLEIEKTRENIASKIKHLKQIEFLIDSAIRTDELKELRKLNRDLLPESTNKENPLPVFRHFTHMGFDIYIGRSSKNNEDLTFGFGHKEDLWLHARDVSGSHVLIKHKAGENYPNPVIERAAQLAAYYSKGKGNTVSPVIYTPKKYVRKLKGGNAGQVIVEKEKVIFVNPTN